MTVAVAIALLAGGTMASAREPIAELSAGGSAAVWTPLAADYDHLVLTVVGPGGVYERREFPAGVGPDFGLSAADGSALPDGVYKWELTLVPVVDEEKRALLTAARRENDGQGVGLPSGSRQSGSFSIVDGAFLATDLVEPVVVGEAPGDPVPASLPGDPQGLVLATNNGVVRYSLCVGGDCPDLPGFGDSTILLMENNTRIKFGDTSNSPYPNRDWEIEANSASSGGASYLGFNDCGTGDNDGGCTTDLVFAVEAGARQSALYVEGDGDIGLGTSNPAAEIHAVRGDTPTVRLEQDGSSGFGAQTWEMAGNETNFFIRDITSGSLLPFRIRPGAPSSSMYLASDGDLGLGTSSPDAVLDLERTSSGEKDVLRISNNGKGNFLFRNTASSGAEDTWTMSHANNGVFAVDVGGGTTELRLQQSGNLIISGSLTTATTTYPDYVFEPDYPLMPLDELRSFIDREGHLPNVLSAAEVDGGRAVNMTRLQIQMLEKVEELTLYTLGQQTIIEGQQRTIEVLEARLAELEEG
jgi:hypothetical protein